ncbi:MAG: PP2C family protein-serine/threonine phosphatase [Terriglobia bacterium]
MSPLAEKWRPHSKAAWGAILSFFSLVGFVAATLSGAAGWRFFFGLLALVLLVFLGWRALVPWRQRLLWRLRNRLLVIYIFIAVVPIILIVGMIGLTAYLVYGQFSTYLVSNQIQQQAEHLAAANRILSINLRQRMEGAAPSSERLRNFLTTACSLLRQETPGLACDALWDKKTMRALGRGRDESTFSLPPWLQAEFHGLIKSGEQLFIRSALPVELSQGRLWLILSLPLDARWLDQVAQTLGGVSVSGPSLRLHSTLTLPSPAHRLDFSISGVSTVDAVLWPGPDAEVPTTIPVGLGVITRPSLLNQRLFRRPGELTLVQFTLLTGIAILFLLMESAALIAGIILTRSITRAITGLYEGTQTVQRGDFSHRILFPTTDQLGALAQSFNRMTGSIQLLIRESEVKQRLENELEIAREVQQQLFPRETPRLRTLDVVGVCRPARVVSGDYYDYGLFAPGKLVFAIGDISGKGISAALLMATIQAALRSQLYAVPIRGDTQQPSPAALVARLNQQLYATTSSEKYASLFCGFYDEAKRLLTYCNAGHMPPAVLGNGQITRLEVGGPVVGVFGDSDYEEGEVRLEPGSLLIAFTDGLTEAENAYGEEFSSDRLLAIFRQNAGMAPERLAETLFNEIQHWVATAEQADDMTLLLVRAR